MFFMIIIIYIYIYYIYISGRRGKLLMLRRRWLSKTEGGRRNLKVVAVGEAVEKVGEEENDPEVRF